MIQIALCVIIVLQLAALLTGDRWMRAQGGSTLQALGLTAAFLVCGASLLFVFSQLGLDIDRHQSILWPAVCGLSMLVGYAFSAVTRRLAAVSFVVAIFLTLEIAATLVLSSSAVGIADASWRSLIIAPAALGLCSYFGASIGFLLLGEGKLNLNIEYEAMIGRRFLLEKGPTRGGGSVLSTVTSISLFGVALGVWLVILGLGILGGFEQDLQTKIIGSGAHVALQQPGGWPFALEEGELKRLDAVTGVEAYAPYLEGEVALASQSNYTVGVLFGIDPKRSPDVLSVLKQMRGGSLQPLIDEAQVEEVEVDEVEAVEAVEVEEAEFPPPKPVPHVVLGREMANTLNVQLGDRVRIISPLLQQMTPIGMAPKTLEFRVAGVFSSKMYDFDARYVYVTLESARRFFEMETAEVSGVQLHTEDPSRSREIGEVASAALGTSVELEALDWTTRNQTLFAALKLERVIAFVVLVFIILVASFSIVSTLTMSVIEKSKEIAILKTMGSRDASIMKVFLTQGLVVGAFGTLVGAIVAIIFAFLLERIGFGIPNDVYYIDRLPVHVGVPDVVLIVLAALLIVWDFAVFPAIRGSRLKPVEGLRDG